MKRFARPALFFYCLLLSAKIAGGQPAEEPLNRINAHLVIKDYAAASQEANQALLSSPIDFRLFQACITALAHSGDEKKMCEVWTRYHRQFPEALVNQELHEIMAWGVIWKGASSGVPLIRLCSLIGAFYGNDAKSTALLRKYCHDKNCLVKSVAVQLISQMRDAQLCDELLRLLSQEVSRRVRLEVIKAVGKMKLKEAHPILIGMLKSDQTGAEEKAAAVESLLFLFENIKKQELLGLVNSNRAGLRLLACQVVSHLRSSENVEEMIDLAGDPNYDVRGAALHTLGLLDIGNFKEAVIKLAQSRLQDPCVEVGIMAAWLLTKLDPDLCQTAFKPFIHHQKKDVRLLAASALAATGKYGVKTALELFKQSREPFFRMNLALGLIYQQVEILDACKVLDSGLTDEPGRWMWQSQGPFRVLAPSQVKQEEEIPNAPEAINQLTRLEILNLLAVMKYPGAETAIREFLQQSKWGISGLASALLLMEGDDVSLGHVQQLLCNSCRRVRMQAALTLALWGGKEEAITVLQEEYSAADRQTKEQILEGLGRIGSRASIPFLIERLQEPQQILRLIAASSLLQCLYH